ncbi:hypothetical protein ASE85_13805 [Sphingobium sp. Leaf26]|nr:hypothetical protein [Sphingobium sp. Leaf26]KQM97942.1 hypothetical protein ASE85_13805 [Sphingobium sp. Leaf26]
MSRLERLVEIGDLDDIAVGQADDQVIAILLQRRHGFPVQLQANDAGVIQGYRIDGSLADFTCRLVDNFGRHRRSLFL